MDGTLTDRPKRADARRNAEAILAAARALLAASDAEPPLEAVASRAGVGIATLYRNFPTRAALVEAVYLDEVERLASAAGDADPADPMRALTDWLRLFTGYLRTKQALLRHLAADSAVRSGCRDRLHGAAETVLAPAQAAGLVRADLTASDLLMLLTPAASPLVADEAQRERLFAVALAGMRA